MTTNGNATTYNADLSRQEGIFNPRIAPFVADVIGVGAVGSAVALLLAKLGTRSINLYDMDVVEHHNLCNQVLYGPADIGLNKAACATRCLRQFGVETQSVDCRVGSRAHLLPSPRHPTRAVFMCVDSMAERARIFDSVVFLNPEVRWFGDARMTARTYMAYGFDPRSVKISREYRSRWYGDDEVKAELGSCGNTLSMGPTAMQCATHLVWNYAATTGVHDGASPWHELLGCAHTGSVHHRGFLSA